jgi:ankyrin repeat protein
MDIITKLHKQDLLKEYFSVLVYQGNIEAIEEVLNDENAIDSSFNVINCVSSKYSDTGYPIHIAIRKNNIPVLELLLSKGANTGVFNKDRESPLRYAVSSNRYEHVKLLLDHGADKEDNYYNDDQSLLYRAIVTYRVSDIRIIQLLLDHNYAWKYRFFNKRTLFHLVMGHPKREEILTLLLKNLEDDTDQRRDAKERIEFINAKDDYGQTAYDVAKECFENTKNDEFKNCMYTLRLYGATEPKKQGCVIS